MKKRRLSTIVALLFMSSYVMAQEGSHFMGLEIMPLYSTSMVNEDVFSKLESPKISFSAGIPYEYQFSYSVSFQTGIYYTSLGYKLKVEDNNPILEEFEDIELEPVSIDSMNGSSSTLDLEYHHNYFYLPVAFKFFVNQGNNSFYFKPGVLAMFNVGDQQDVRYTNPYQNVNTVKENKVEYRTFNLGLSLSAGLQTSIAYGWDFFVEPTVMVTTLGLAKDSNVNRNLMAFGLATGFRMDLSKAAH